MLYSHHTPANCVLCFRATQAVVLMVVVAIINKLCLLRKVYQHCMCVVPSVLDVCVSACDERAKSGRAHVPWLIRRIFFGVE